VRVPALAGVSGDAQGVNNRFAQSSFYRKWALQSKYDERKLMTVQD
jgi:hypothetical protein